MKIMMNDFQGFILFMILFLSSVFLWAFFKRRIMTGVPPGPLALPIIGHLHLLAPIPHQALHKLSTQYGPIMQIFLGSVPCIVASSSETAKDFLKTHESSFSNRPQSFAVDYLTYGSKDFSFAPYGPYWKFMKKLCMSELLGGRTLDLLGPVRREEVRTFLERVTKSARSGKAIDVGGELIRLTNNVISRMVMSERCSENEEEAGEVRKLVQETAELTGKFNLSDFIWFLKNVDLQGFGKRLKDVRERFDGMMERIIREHEEARSRLMMNRDGNDCSDQPKDLLDIMLDISEDEKSEMKLTRENIKAFILDIFAAGTDTSAITTEWAMAELINHPNIMKRAQEEIDFIVGKDRLVEESDISSLHYLRAIVKETLRLHPTGPLIVRESNESSCVNGYNIPPKTRLFVNVWSIGRDPRHWINPLEFKPDRFLGEDGKGQMDVRGQHFELIPFGTGRRGCPGTSLALQLIQTSLATMIQCFDWEVDGGKGKVDMEEGLGLTLPMAHPLLCVPISRLSLPS